MDTATAPYGVFLLFLLAVVITIVICATSTMRRRNNVHDQTSTDVMQSENTQNKSKWERIKNAVSSLAHCGSESGEVEGKAVLRMEDNNASIVNTPPLWQRKIMMGERCEVPKFSGLILYDERGRPIQSNCLPCRAPVQQQVKPKAEVTTTLRDLL